MNKGLRAFGHPMHVMLVHFPIALWSVAPLCDAVWLWRSEILWAQMSFWSLVAGLTAVVPVAVTGFVDYLGLAEGSIAERIAMRHMIVMLSAAGMVTLGLLIHGLPTTVTSMRVIISMAITSGGLVLMGFGAWLGGELVLRHGVGRPELSK